MLISPLEIDALIRRYQPSYLNFSAEPDFNFCFIDRNVLRVYHRGSFQYTIHICKFNLDFLYEVDLWSYARYTTPKGSLPFCFSEVQAWSASIINNPRTGELFKAMYFRNFHVDGFLE